MSTPFDPVDGLIVVSTRLVGPAERIVARLALDTGATATIISAAILQFIGYDPASSSERVRVTTGTGVAYAPRLSVSGIAALELEKSDFPVVCHTLPPSASIDGLLGLDFLRGYRLTIDFRIGTLTLQ